MSMSFVLTNVLTVAALFVAMLAAQKWGLRLGERHHRLDPAHETGGGATEAAIYGLLGLFLAFTFSGAASRFDERRRLIVEEANDIGTAWLRLDLLPAADQPHLRDLFRQYLDTRLETYRLLPDMDAAVAEHAKALGLQQEIWTAAVASANSSGRVPPFSVLLPALNAMFDIATVRISTARLHPPPVVFTMVAFLALLGSIFVGYGAASRKARSWLHTIGFAAVMAITLFVIVEFEYPRFGLIRIDAMDQVLIDMRRSMQ